MTHSAKSAHLRVCFEDSGLMTPPNIPDSLAHLILALDPDCVDFDKAALPAGSDKSSHQSGFWVSSKIFDAPTHRIAILRTDC
mmetsp:Transcript_14079/g.34093  ORF Transcript_14079/g.34093 Transcript_14079/m.34093 type:complete len:83 (-) Transcript_14079:498-746(-)